MSQLLFIDNYDSFTYNIIQALEILGARLCIYQHDDPHLSSIDAISFDALIISPGPGHPRDSGHSISLIKKLHGLRPILGICLGHQAIAQAFGGTVGHAKEIVHGKAYWINHQQRGLFRDLPSPFLVGRYHSLAIHTLPEGFSSNAHSDDGTIMSIQHHQHPTYGLQFHPESILTPIGMQLFSNFLNTLS